jgi:hypothetical protein
MCRGGPPEFRAAVAATRGAAGVWSGPATKWRSVRSPTGENSAWSARFLNVWTVLAITCFPLEELVLNT